MSFLWSLTGGSKKTDAASTQHVPPAPALSTQPLRSMNNAFKKGVQYNMKIAIRGDVMTGKTTLFNRLQGKEFEEAYTSTPQIQVENIPWHYKDSNDMVKIEVWDVVDQALNKSSKKTDTGIKLEHNTSTTQKQPATSAQSTTHNSEEPLSLDATTVDVYRGTHAVLFLFDITKQWTFTYVKKELDKVPEFVSVLVLGNFCDKSEQRVEAEVIQKALYEHNQLRIKKGAIKPNLIRYAETSLKSGQGLKYIYEYLGVPFLQLMTESLQKQLELKTVEIVDLLECLDCDDEVPESMRRRRGQENFDQPSQSSHLAHQQQELETAWQDTPISHDIGLRDSIDPFESAQLDEDWLGDESLPVQVTKSHRQSREEVRNPMVADDEDVESVEYYQDHTQILKASTDESDTEPEEVTYKSTLDAERLQATAVVSSDSEEEDNMNTEFGGPMRSFYEDIGEDGGNPWSLDAQGAIRQTYDNFGNNEDKEEEETKEAGDTTAIKKTKKKKSSKKTKRKPEKNQA